MPSKKLTKQKREELKTKNNQSNFLLPLTVLIIVAVVIAGAVLFLLPDEEKDSNNDNINDSDPQDNTINTNSAPVAYTDYIKVEKNSVNNSIDVLANDTDADNDNLNILSVDKPENGNASIVEEKIYYSPDNNFTGYDVFNYIISDGKNHTASATITVVVDDANPLAFMNTSKGVIVLELYEDKVQNTVDNFIKLANEGFYEGIIFHRVSDDFMIQAGNTLANGSTKSSPYGSIDLETHPDVRHVDGTISMARTNDPDSATSQFFICDGAQSFLDDNYAAFGVVISGIDVVRDIADEDHDGSFDPNPGGGKPLEDIVINSVIIKNE